MCGTILRGAAPTTIGSHPHPDRQAARHVEPTDGTRGEFGLVVGDREVEFFCRRVGLEYPLVWAGAIGRVDGAQHLVSREDVEDGQPKASVSTAPSTRSPIGML